MEMEDRRQLAEDLVGMIGKQLSGELCTGTGKQMRERMQVMSSLMARVSAVVMHEGPTDGDLLLRIRRYEVEMDRCSKATARPVWKVK